MILDNLTSMIDRLGLLDVNQSGGKTKTHSMKSMKGKNVGGDDGTVSFDCIYDNNQYVCDPTGGMSKMQYKAYLAKMDVKRLYKIAKNKGIKITKKKDGKTSYIKKDTVVQKIYDVMYGKKK